MDRLTHFFTCVNAETIAFIRQCLSEIDPDALSASWHVPGHLGFDLLDDLQTAMWLLCPKIKVTANDSDINDMSVTFTWSAGDMPRL